MRRSARAAPARAGGCRLCRGRRAWRRRAGWVTGCVRCSWSSLSVRCPRAVAARHQQVRGDVLFLPRLERALFAAPGDRKSVVSGKSVSVRVDLGGRRIIKKKKQVTRRKHRSRKSHEKRTNGPLHTTAKEHN